MFLLDVRHSLRMLAKSPGFAIVAILSIALGIGVNSAMFSFHDAILLRPLPVRDPGSVVTLTATTPDVPAIAGRLSYPNYRDLQNKSRSFDGLFADQLMLLSFGRSRSATREMRMGMLVSENFFRVLGVQPLPGRGFKPEEGAVPGRDAVVVLGHDFWKYTLGADASILNQVVVINGIDFTVIGVAPESFPGLDQFIRPAFYVPSMMAERVATASVTSLEDRKARAWEVKGRLKSGVSLKQAEAEMTTLWRELERQYPEENRNRVMAVRTELRQRIRSNPPTAVLSLMMTALAGVVLLIACANVANLMLGRARAR